MKNWHLMLIALFTLTLTSACGPAELGSADSESSDECQIDGDCAKGERCKPDPDGNMCVPKDDSGDPECTKNADCEKGEVCDKDNMCVEDTSSECTEDSDCEGGMVCLDDICVDQNTDECNEDSDCDNGESCKANTCVTDECTSDEDCASDEVCKKYSDKANMCVDDGDSPETHEVRVVYTTPGDESAEYITLSGVFHNTDGEIVSGWKERGRVGGRSEIEVVFTNVEPGKFRGSVEYVIDGQKSWDCIDPTGDPDDFQRRGALRTYVDGEEVDFESADDPDEFVRGCGHQFYIP